jgi:hypothetical protein
MRPIYTPYDPEQVTGEFGWLWLDDGSMGSEWHLVQTYYETDDELTTWFAGDGDGHESTCAPADSYRGLPYLSATAPTCTPGEVDRLEVAVRFGDGASFGHAFGNAAQAAGIEAALSWLLSPGDARPRAAVDVLAERRRQVEAEGFTPEHDDQWSDYELARSASEYVLVAATNPASRRWFGAGTPSDGWPFPAEWWKPTTRRHDLVKAGALILAEIERLDRLAKRGEAG